ncbi:MAG: hypothetical protein ACJA2E_002541 [Arenicella sp.]|jgi:hypothetical protein
MSSKKYQSEVLQEGDSWTARITRQITSRKSLVSKQQDGLASEAEANAWVETNMAEFISTQKSANSRQGGSRKDQEEIKRQRSSRRAEKTEVTKQAKKDAALTEQSSKTDSNFEAEFDSFDDE